jgi:hypothetical protein
MVFEKRLKGRREKRIESWRDLKRETWKFMRRIEIKLEDFSEQLREIEQLEILSKRERNRNNSSNFIAISEEPEELIVSENSLLKIAIVSFHSSLLSSHSFPHYEQKGVKTFPPLPQISN